MKLLQLILFATQWIAFSSLQAGYTELQIGKGYGQCVLSPDRKFLVEKNHIYDFENNIDSTIATIWNIETGQPHGTFEGDGGLFFSSDSTMLFVNIFNDAIKQYLITKEDAQLINSIANKYSYVLPDFPHRGASAYTCINGTNTPHLINFRISERDSSFIRTTLDPSVKTITTQSLDVPKGSKRFQWFSISSDAQNGAFVANGKYFDFLCIVNLETQKTIRNYMFKRIAHVNSVGFSCNKNKLILSVNHSYYNHRTHKDCSDHWFAIIDLITNQSSWFKQEEYIRYAAFIDDATVLTVYSNGSINYHELTSENLSRSNEKLKVLSDKGKDLTRFKERYRW